MNKSFDERNLAKSRAACEAMAKMADTGERILSEAEKLILNIWPKFEDGGYAWFGDAYIDAAGDPNEVMEVVFDGDCARLVGIEGCHTVFELGDRVRWPCQSVLDADDVEINVGDTVLNDDGGEWLVEEINAYGVRCFDGERRRTLSPRRLTHTRPDSWERLEEDASKEPCDYFGVECDDDKGCSGCPHLHERCDCTIDLQADLVRRAKALAGVEVD